MPASLSDSWAGSLPARPARSVPATTTSPSRARALPGTGASSQVHVSSSRMADSGYAGARSPPRVTFRRCSNEYDRDNACHPPTTLTNRAVWFGAPPACSCRSLADAQSSAVIVGTVRDSTGGPLADARIVLAAARTRESGAKRRQPARGRSSCPACSPARLFELEVSAAGFDVGAPVAVRADGRRAPPGRRAPDRRGRRRSRSASRADTSIRRTVSPELGGHIERAQLDRLPVNGRDLIAVAYLVPGAAPARGFYNLAPRLTINGVVVAGDQLHRGRVRQHRSVSRRTEDSRDPRLDRRPEGAGQRLLAPSTAAPAMASSRSRRAAAATQRRASSSTWCGPGACSIRRTSSLRATRPAR